MIIRVGQEEQKQVSGAPNSRVLITGCVLEPCGLLKTTVGAYTTGWDAGRLGKTGAQYL